MSDTPRTDAEYDNALEFEFDSEDLYREKIAVIKENYFPKDSSKSAEQTLVEETTGKEPIFEDTSDVMSKYVKALSKSVKSR